MIRLLLAALLAGVLCGPGAAQTQGTQPGGAISVESDRAQDFATRDRIMDILGQLDGYADVRATVSNGIVTLRGTVVDGTRIGALNELVARIEGVVAIENEVRESTDVVERLNPALERMRDRFDQFIAFSPLILVALSAGVLLTWFGLWLARRSWPWDRIAPNAFIADIYRQIVRLTFVVLGVVMALDLLNATALLGTILGAAGIVGLAIGFAVRDTVENFISSIMLSIRQPFRPKDLVEIEGELGHVILLTSRATILLSLDGNHIRIPNATVFKAKITNFTRNDERRFSFVMGVDPDADLARAQSVMLAALGELPFVLDTPGPAVWVEGLGHSTIDITAAGWIKQHETDIGMAKGEAIRIVKSRLDEAGIAMPDPTYRLIGTEQVGITAQAPPAAPSAQPPRHADIRPVGTDHTEALTGIIEAEREALPDNDLLHREAPQE